MLDFDMKEQLRSVFSKLEHVVVLRYAQATHPAQSELEEMLRDLASTSEKLKVVQSDEASDAPKFELFVSDMPTGISFRGVPGGHEFSSLVLSILYADGKGKRPDDGIVKRIQALRGPIRLKTYISLSCENCPEVVQALNLMASLHSDFHHEMVDGAVAEGEVAELGIQGVPSVVSNGTLIVSGKISLIDLIAKFEAAFGKGEVSQNELNLGTFDVVVIGGGPAGASAAIYSARKGLRTAMIAERFGGQLQETKGIENMISVSYTEGVQLAAQLSDHVAAYDIATFEHRRVAKIVPGVMKRIELESGEFVDARVIIVATGAQWRKLGVPGEKENIGQGVAFCAHCDGPFYKGKRVAVVGGGNSGVEAAIDLSSIASQVTLLEMGDRLKADDVLIAKLKSISNAAILTNAKSTRVLDDGRKVIGLEYQVRDSDRPQVLNLDGVFVQIGLLPNSQFVRGLIEVTPSGEIVVDSKGRTSIPGIYAAGDVTTIPFKQIVTAMGDGAKVALAAFEDQMRASAVVYTAE